MTQAVADRDDVGSGLEQVNSHAMSHAVGVKSLRVQCGLLCFGTATVLGEDVSNPKPRQWSAAVVKKEWFTIVGINLSFRKESFADLGSLWPKSADAFFAPLSEKPCMERPLQLKIARPEIDDFLNTAAGVKHHHQEKVVTPAIG
jgi:hypothetical protein